MFDGQQQNPILGYRGFKGARTGAFEGQNREVRCEHDQGWNVSFIM
jgi:hypothetical protein